MDMPLDNPYIPPCMSPGTPLKGRLKIFVIRVSGRHSGDVAQKESEA